MKKILYSITLCAVLVVAVFPAAAMAGPDLFSGDTRIYGGSPVVLQPNVLIIIDNSGSMADTVPGGGSVYNNAITYAATFNCTNSSGFDGSSCDANTVYDASYIYLTSPATSLPTCTFTVDNSHYVSGGGGGVGSTHDNTIINYSSLITQYGTITQPKLNFTSGVASCCYKNVTVCTSFKTTNPNKGSCNDHCYVSKRFLR